MAIEADETAFELKGTNFFLYHLSFVSLASQNIRNGYEKIADEEGKQCMAKVENRLNRTIANFKNDITSIAEDEQMLRVYLEHTSSLVKRSATGAVAIALGIVDLVATGASYFYTDYQIRILREKLSEIDEMVSEMIADKIILKENQDFLFKEGKILGVNENLLIGHFNNLQRIHACDFLTVQMETDIARINDKLYRLKRSVLKNELSSDVLDIKTLERITTMSSFRDTVYILAPLELYRKAKLSIYSVNDEGVTFVVSYPEIGRTPVFKVASVLETSKHLLVPRNSDVNFRFLLPFNASLDKLNITETPPRSVESCIHVSSYMACHPFSVFPTRTQDCIESLFSKSDSSCFGRKIESSLGLSYGKSGVLVETKEHSDILDAKTGQIMRRLSGHLCTYAKDYKNLAIRIGKVVTPIFRNHLVINGKTDLSTRKIEFHSKTIQNVSLPEFKNPHTFRNLTQSHKRSIFHYLENPWVSGTIIAMFICSAIIFSLVMICVSRSCERGGTNVGVQLGGLDAGRIATF